MELDGLEAHRERARAFAERAIAPSAAARDREARWDGELFRRMGEAGLFRAGLPLRYGGSDLRAPSVSQLQIGFGEGSGDAGLALAWIAHLAGCVTPILRFGSEAQRRRCLPALGVGEWIGGPAHDETPVEGDPIGIRTRATKRGGRWILQGRKRRVVNGSVAQILVVTAITDPRRGKEGVSAFLVERGAPGLRATGRIETSGMRTATIADVTFDDCEVPDDALLGAEGAGLTQVTRLIRRWQRGCLFAPWIGLMKALLDRSVAHAREHFQLGRPLARSQLVRATLADMRIRYELCQRLQARSAAQLDHGDASADRDLAAARLFLAESVALSARDAAQIHGADGLEVDRFSERLQRDAAVLAHLDEDRATLRSVIAGALLGLG